MTGKLVIVSKNQSLIKVHLPGEPFQETEVRSTELHPSRGVQSRPASTPCRRSQPEASGTGRRTLLQRHLGTKITKIGIWF